MKKTKYILTHFYCAYNPFCINSSEPCKSKKTFASKENALKHVKEYYLNEGGFEEDDAEDMEYINSILDILSVEYEWSSKNESETWRIECV